LHALVKEERVADPGDVPERTHEEGAHEDAHHHDRAAIIGDETLSPTLSPTGAGVHEPLL